jgi:hypothetical protein
MGKVRCNRKARAQAQAMAVAMILCAQAAPAADYDLDTTNCSLAPDPSAIGVLTERTFQVREETAGHAVLAAEAAWPAFWAEHGAGQPQHEVSASTQVVVAWLGERPHPGFGMRLAGVRCEGSALTLTFEATLPDPEMNYPMMLFYPAMAVAVPAASDSIEVELP